PAHVVFPAEVELAKLLEVLHGSPSWSTVPPPGGPRRREGLRPDHRMIRCADRDPQRDDAERSGIMTPGRCDLGPAGNDLTPVGPHPSTEVWPGRRNDRLAAHGKIIPVDLTREKSSAK